MTQTSYAGLPGRVVLITGGASGIGAAFVRAFAAQQARVAFLDIDADAGEALVQELASECERAPLFVPCDLLDIAALRAAMVRVRATRTTRGPLYDAVSRDASKLSTNRLHRANVTNILVTPDGSSADGKPWAPFSAAAAGSADTMPQQAPLGFAIVSQSLLLSGGHRGAQIAQIRSADAISNAVRVLRRTT